MSWQNAGPPTFTAMPEPQKRQSRWLWWVFLGFGTVSCVGFIIVAIKVHNRKFVHAAMISVVAAAVCIGTVSIWPPVDEVSRTTRSDTSTEVGNASISGWIIMAIWAGLILYGLILNQDYKKFLREQDDEDTRRRKSSEARAPVFYHRPATPGTATSSYPPPPPSAPVNNAPSAPPVDVSRIEADRYFATQPAGNPPAADPPNAPLT